MWISVLLLVFGIFHSCLAESQKFKSIRKATASGCQHKTQALRSKIEFAASCMEDASCDVGCYGDGTGQCQLFSWNCVSFNNPNNPGQDTSTLIIRGLELVMVYVSTGDETVHDDTCQAFQGEMTTYSQLEYVFNNMGLHSGSCGRVAGGSLYYALQSEVPGIGYQGINECFWATEGYVYCTVVPGLPA